MMSLARLMGRPGKFTGVGSGIGAGLTQTERVVGIEGRLYRASLWRRGC
jgi:hypothetical protein